MPATSTQPELHRVRYRERLTAPWWLWTLGLVVGIILAAEVHLGYPGLRAWLPYAVLLPLIGAALLWLGRLAITVTEHDLQVDDAVISLDLVTKVTPLHGAALREQLGPDLAENAFVITRPWIRRAVRIEIADPDDPTPYWIVSMRRPTALLTIVAARQPASQPAATTAGQNGGLGPSSPSAPA